MASDGPSSHPPSLRLNLIATQPSRRHHAQSLRSPSVHDPRTLHVLESHTERAAPLSRHDDERCHAIVSHSVLTLAATREGLKRLPLQSLLQEYREALQRRETVSFLSLNMLHTNKHCNPCKMYFIHVLGSRTRVSEMYFIHLS